MVPPKSEDVTMQGFCKILWRKLRLREGLLLSLIAETNCGIARILGILLMNSWDT